MRGYFTLAKQPSSNLNFELGFAMGKDSERFSSQIYHDRKRREVYQCLMKDNSGVEHDDIGDNDNDTNLEATEDVECCCCRLWIKIYLLQLCNWQHGSCWQHMESSWSTNEKDGSEDFSYCFVDDPLLGKIEIFGIRVWFVIHPALIVIWLQC